MSRRGEARYSEGGEEEEGGEYPRSAYASSGAPSGPSRQPRELAGPASWRDIDFSQEVEPVPEEEEEEGYEDDHSHRGGGQAYRGQRGGAYDRDQPAHVRTQGVALHDRHRRERDHHRDEYGEEQEKGAYGAGPRRRSQSHGSEEEEEEEREELYRQVPPEDYDDTYTRPQSLRYSPQTSQAGGIGGARIAAGAPAARAGPMAARGVLPGETAPALGPLPSQEPQYRSRQQHRRSASVTAVGARPNPFEEEDEEEEERERERAREREREREGERGGIAQVPEEECDLGSEPPPWEQPPLDPKFLPKVIKSGGQLWEMYAGPTCNILRREDHNDLSPQELAALVANPMRPTRHRRTKSAAPHLSGDSLRAIESLAAAAREGANGPAGGGGAGAPLPAGQAKPAQLPAGKVKPSGATSAGANGAGVGPKGGATKPPVSGQPGNQAGSPSPGSSWKGSPDGARRRSAAEVVDEFLSGHSQGAREGPQAQGRHRRGLSGSSRQGSLTLPDLPEEPEPEPRHAQGYSPPHRDSAQGDRGPPAHAKPRQGRGYSPDAGSQIDLGRSLPNPRVASSAPQRPWQPSAQGQRSGSGAHRRSQSYSMEHFSGDIARSATHGAVLQRPQHGGGFPLSHPNRPPLAHQRRPGSGGGYTAGALPPLRYPAQDRHALSQLGPGGDGEQEEAPWGYTDSHGRGGGAPWGGHRVGRPGHQRAASVGPGAFEARQWYDDADEDEGEGGGGPAYWEDEEEGGGGSVRASRRSSSSSRDQAWEGRRGGSERERDEISTPVLIERISSVGTDNARFRSGCPGPPAWAPGPGPRAGGVPPAANSREGVRRGSPGEGPVGQGHAHAQAQEREATPPALSVLELPFSDIKEDYSFGTREEVLGKGRLATVCACVHRRSGRRFACKSIHKDRLQSDAEVDDVRCEVAIMEMLQGHPTAVQLHATYEDEDFVHLVLELCEGGELWERLKARKRYSEAEAADVAQAVLELLAFCHRKGIMHRDVKPENVLLLRADDDVSVRVIDYGVSVFFNPGERFSEIVGSPFYVAPEVLHESYGPEADVWSVGVILYTLLAGYPPFWGDSDEAVFRAILETQADVARAPWGHISNSAKNLVLQLLHKDPHARITAEHALQHPWLCEREF